MAKLGRFLRFTKIMLIFAGLFKPRLAMKYPMGIKTFQEIMEDGCADVGKTALARQAVGTH